MNKIKIIFFDIDGTLVSFKTHTIPQSTLDAIHHVRENGVKVWIATGRPLPFITNLGELEYDGVVSVTGAHCQTREGHVIFSQPVDKADIQRMIQRQHETGIAVTYAGNDRAIVTAPNGVPTAVTEVFKLLDLDEPQLYEPEEALRFDVMQVIAFFRDEETDDVMGHVLQNCSDSRWHPAFADCVAKGVNKAVGIDKVLEYYGFDIADAMAFGDGSNDIEMLRHVGTGVAMGNASDEVKAAADIVTTSVDEDGVANIILAFSEGNELLYCIALGYPNESPKAKPRTLDKIRFIE